MVQWVTAEIRSVKDKPFYCLSTVKGVSLYSSPFARQVALFFAPLAESSKAYLCHDSERHPLQQKLSSRLLQALNRRDLQISTLIEVAVTRIVMVATCSALAHASVALVLGASETCPSAYFLPRALRPASWFCLGVAVLFLCTVARELLLLCVDLALARVRDTAACMVVPWVA